MFEALRELYRKYLRKYRWARFSANCFWRTYWKIYLLSGFLIQVCLKYTFHQFLWGRRLTAGFVRLYHVTFGLVNLDQMNRIAIANNYGLLKDVLVVGYSRFIYRDQRACLPEIENPELTSALDRYYLQEEVVRVAKVNLVDRTVCADRLRVYDYLPGRWISSLSPSSSNWMHWLAEIYPEIVKLAAVQTEPFGILVDAYVPNQIVESLEILVDIKQIISVRSRKQMHVKELIVPLKPSANWSVFWSRSDKVLPGEFHFDPDALHAARKAILEFHALVQPRPVHNIFIERKSMLRKIDNQQDVNRLLITHGYEAVDPVSMSFSEQVACFSNAGGVVAQAGAALANIMFMPKGGRVICFAANNEAINYDYFKRYADIFGVKLEYIIGEVRNLAAYKAYKLASPKHPMNAGFQISLVQLQATLGFNDNASARIN